MAASKFATVTGLEPEISSSLHFSCGLVTSWIQIDQLTNQHSYVKREELHNEKRVGLHFFGRFYIMNFDHNCG